MSLLKKVKNIFRKAADDAEDALTDVERDSKYAIEDAEKDLREKKMTVAKHVQAVKRSEDDLESALREVRKWVGILAKAVAADDGEAMETADGRVSQYKADAVEYKKVLDNSKQLLDRMKGQIESLERRITDSKRKQSTLVARSNSAKMAKQLSGFDPDDSPLDELEALEDVVETAEYAAHAAVDMTTSVADEIERKYERTNAAAEFDSMFDSSDAGDSSGGDSD